MEPVMVESLVLIYNPIKPSRYIVVIFLLWGQAEIFVMTALKYRWQPFMKYGLSLSLPLSLNCSVVKLTFCTKPGQNAVCDSAKKDEKY